jgi:hypothetical protein
MSPDIVEATSIHLGKSAYEVFQESLTGCLQEQYTPKRIEALFSAYQTEDFVPAAVEAWCLVKLLGTTAKKRSTS